MSAGFVSDQIHEGPSCTVCGAIMAEFGECDMSSGFVHQKDHPPRPTEKDAEYEKCRNFKFHYFKCLSCGSTPELTSASLSAERTHPDDFFAQRMARARARQQHNAREHVCKFPDHSNLDVGARYDCRVCKTMWEMTDITEDGPTWESIGEIEEVVVGETQGVREPMSATSEVGIPPLENILRSMLMFVPQGHYLHRCVKDYLHARHCMESKDS